MIVVLSMNFDDNDRCVHKMSPNYILMN